jgi:hypothetical protein
MRTLATATRTTQQGQRTEVDVSGRPFQMSEGVPLDERYASRRDSEEPPSSRRHRAVTSGLICRVAVRTSSTATALRPATRRSTLIAKLRDADRHWKPGSSCGLEEQERQRCRRPRQVVQVRHPIMPTCTHPNARRISEHSASAQVLIRSLAAKNISETARRTIVEALHRDAPRARTFDVSTTEGAVAYIQTLNRKQALEVAQKLPAGRDQGARRGAIPAARPRHTERAKRDV